jgi:hypothetical protein
MLRLLMEQRIVISFFVLKKFKVKAIKIELESIYRINVCY